MAVPLQHHRSRHRLADASGPHPRTTCRTIRLAADTGRRKWVSILVQTAHRTVWQRSRNLTRIERATFVQGGMGGKPHLQVLCGWNSIYDHKDWNEHRKRRMNVVDFRRYSFWHCETCTGFLWHSLGPGSAADFFSVTHHACTLFMARLVWRVIMILSENH